MTKYTPLLLVEETLKFFAPKNIAYWNGKEMICLDPFSNAEVTVAKVTSVNLKLPKGPNDKTSNYASHKRVISRPYLFLNNTQLTGETENGVKKPSTSPMAEFIAKDFTPAEYKNHPEQPEYLAAVMALYSICLPEIIKSSGLEKLPEDSRARAEFYSQSKTQFISAIRYAAHLQLDSYHQFLHQIDPNLDLNHTKTGIVDFINLYLNPKYHKKIISLLFNQTQSSGGILSTRQRITDTIKTAARRGAVGALNRRTVRAITSSFGPNAPDWMHTQAAQRIMSILVPVLGQTLIDLDTGDRIPRKLKERINSLLNQALESEVDHVTGEVLDQVFEQAWPLIEGWIQEAQRLESSDTESAFVDADSEVEERPKSANLADLLMATAKKE